MQYPDDLGYNDLTLLIFGLTVVLAAVAALLR